MKTRMKNPGQILPEAMEAIQGMMGAIQSSGAPEAVLHLTHLRASQINGCSFCVDAGVKQAKRSGETDERLHAVAAWREAAGFSQAERAALALTESMTRLADRGEGVPDAVWDEAAKHYDQRALAGLVLGIALTNLFNRVNVATRQAPGVW